MRRIPRLVSDTAFPSSCEALDYPNGLLAFGGGLSVQRLLDAYRRGFFPWYQAPQPVLWWTPDPRSVLFPGDLHISRSLRKTLRSNIFKLGVDRNFIQVMRECARVRREGIGTWIDDDMLEAYCAAAQARVRPLGGGNGRNGDAGRRAVRCVTGASVFRRIHVQCGLRCL